MATTAKNTTKRTSATTKPKSTTTSTPRSDSSQVREGVTKARNGAVSIAVATAERAVDLPVGYALIVRDRVEEVIEPWTTPSTRERELKSLRTQVTRELNKAERRGGQARRKTVTSIRSTRKNVEREVKARRREVEKAIKQNRTKVEKAVKENRTKAEAQLKKAQKTVSERVPALS
jgi:ElaB/YqjD/DUF883 family membrane-anchored ribosome-binding protein